MKGDLDHFFGKINPNFKVLVHPLGVLTVLETQGWTKNGSTLNCRLDQIQNPDPVHPGALMVQPENT